MKWGLEARVAVSHLAYAIIGPHYDRRQYQMGDSHSVTHELVLSTIVLFFKSVWLLYTVHITDINGFDL